MSKNRGINIGSGLQPGDVVRVVGGTLVFVEKEKITHNGTSTTWFVFRDGDATVNIPASKLAQHFGGPNGGVK